MKQPIMKYLVTFVFICSVTLSFQGCGKDDETSPPPPPPPPSGPKDTLTAGWQRIYIDSSTFIVDISFPTSQIGYICGDKYVGKSIDGGLTWTKFNFPDSLNGRFSFMYFKDENTGWVTTQNSVIRTTDGGLTWKKTQTVLNNPADIQFPTANVGYVTTLDGLHKSVDGGATFQKIPSAGSSTHYGVFFFDENNGWITASGGIQATQDGGISYNKRTLLNPGDYYNVLFIDANIGWVSGSGGNYIWFTKNGGTSWDKISDLGVQNDVHFFNANEGYISTRNEIYKTTNAGSTLTRVLYSAKGQIVETCFTDPDHGWATAGAYIYRYVK